MPALHDAVNGTIIIAFVGFIVTALDSITPQGLQAIIQLPQALAISFARAAAAAKQIAVPQLVMEAFHLVMVSSAEFLPFSQDQADTFWPSK